MKKCNITNLIDLIDSFQNVKTISVIHNGKPISYDDFYKEIVSLSGKLLKSDESDEYNEKVIISLANKYDLLVAIYASIYSKKIAVPIEPNQNDTCIDQINHKVQPTFWIKENMIINHVGKTHTANTKLVFENKHFPGQEVSIDEQSALILLTSGTTGDRKAVSLSHKNITQTSVEINKFTRAKPGIIEYLMVPLYHSFGFARTRCVFLLQGTLIIDDGFFNPLLAIKRIKTNNVNSLSGVPATFLLLLNAKKIQLKSIGSIISVIEMGSAYMSTENKLKLMDIFPNARICMHYGLTEASRTSFIEFHSEKNKLQSVGKPTAGVQVYITQKNHQPLPVGEKGLISVTGPNVALGYVNDEILTHQKFCCGTFYSDDIGYFDTDGYLYYCGRNDDIINFGGKKISSLEIEGILLSSGLIHYEFVVLALPDVLSIYGQNISLFVSTSGRTGETVDLKSINSFLNDSGIDNIFLVKKVIYVDSFPYTDNGKIKRKELYHYGQNS